MTQSPSPTILIVDDDEGHAILIRENLEAAGLHNRMEHFRDGQAILDFFAQRVVTDTASYLLLLDIRMPKVDGIEVLRRLKADSTLGKLPIIMLTTTDDTREVERAGAADEFPLNSTRSCLQPSHRPACSSSTTTMAF
jgi:CheY-like chemotaxis protein